MLKCLTLIKKEKVEITWLWLQDNYTEVFHFIYIHFRDIIIYENTNKRHREVESLMKRLTDISWCAWCHGNQYLCVFVEVLRCPVLYVGLRGGLSQGEFWENATAGAWHHIPGISTGFKLGTGSEVLRLTDRRRQTMIRRGNRKCLSSLCSCTTTVEGFSGTQRRSWLGLILTC